MSDIWVLGATGRSGRAIATHLAARQLSPVLVGRDATRLRQIAAAIGQDVRIVVASSVDAVVAAVSRGNPAVVVNTIGPFTETAVPIARACPPGTHYVDLSNELSSVIELLGMHDAAVSSGRTFVTGAGFGVLATESVVLKLCEGQPPATQVRVDALPVVEVEPGRIGSALAAAIIDAIADGGRRYAHGKLVRARLFGDLESLTLPDGFAAKTADGPSGELEAARRASGASFAVAASSLAPSAPVLRAILPAALTLLRITALRSLAKRRVAAITIKPKTRTDAKQQERRRESSWAHARVRWASGESREGWLRLGDAMAFTIAVVVEVTCRLAHDGGRPGAYTPGALFGPELAVKAGGAFILDQARGRIKNGPVAITTGPQVKGPG